MGVVNNIQRYNIDQAAEKWQTDKGRWCKWEDVNDLLIKHVDLIKGGYPSHQKAWKELFSTFDKSWAAFNAA